MKSFVITIESIEKSVQAANRCIKTGKKYGFEIEKFKATTPADNPIEIIHKLGISPQGFAEKYSRRENCIAAFLSHYYLWKKAVDTNENIIIFEHDAIITGSLPENFKFNKVITFSKPSYGKFNTPIKIGVDGLVQKQYFGGAHGYIVSPEGAKILIEKSKIEAAPTDVFLNLNLFPWLEELYPWICIASDSFTTIQKEAGCLAKHRYDETYEII
jgi:GR25 family glycosyltransferase involved in LPS biosynthesis|tara:strand:+ start:266 stop:910 length:645 start_codon:yes stop_codon:yes gene_type:complete